MTRMNPLRRRMIEDMTIRNLSPATQRSYLHAVAKFSAYFGKSPDLLGVEDVRTYQVHLAGKGIAWATLNQVVCALRFFYGITLGDDVIPERIPYARTPKSLPVILSADEVKRFLEAVFQPQMPDCPDDGLFGGLAGIGSRRHPDCRHRQRPHGHPCPPRQGRPGPLRDVVGSDADDSAGPIGSARSPVAICFRAATMITPCNRPPCMPPAGPRPRQPGWVNGSRSILCATALPLICWSRVRISVSSRPCWVIAACRARRATREFRRVRSGPRRARWRACRWR